MLLKWLFTPTNKKSLCFYRSYSARVGRGEGRGQMTSRQFWKGFWDQAECDLGSRSCITLGEALIPEAEFSA